MDLDLADVLLCQGISEHQIDPLQVYVTLKASQRIVNILTEFLTLQISRFSCSVPSSIFIGTSSLGLTATITHPVR